MAGMGDCVKKLKWRGRELLERSAAPVEKIGNGYTPRPLPAGKTDFTPTQIAAFASFSRRHLLAIPYVGMDKIVFVPVMDGRQAPFILGLKSDYTAGTWVAIDFSGTVSVNISHLGTCLSKRYAEDFFGLLLSYQNTSASEAASRLGLHIRTAQEFLDGLVELDILVKQKVTEKKRSYFRYSRKTRRIFLALDLTEIQTNQITENLTRRIREKANARANFSLARGGEFISHVTFWVGDGREGKERKISLTNPQGVFLYHLPFPIVEFQSISDIIHKAGLSEEVAPEILDIVNLLEQHGIIETEVYSE